MNPTVAAFLRSWTFAPWTIASCAVTLLLYFRGWRKLSRKRSSHWSTRELIAFVGGWLALIVAVCSPLDSYAGLLLSAHMVQHILLMFVAPPLLLSGAPELPLLHGLPREVLRYWASPLLRSPMLRATFRWLAHPAVAWLLSTGMLFAWHLPVLYQLALDSAVWHVVEHGCFFFSALLFWWPVVQPWPSRAVWPRPAIVAYLFLALMPATVLCAFFSFADRVIYPRYDAVPRVGGISALTDQAVAGAMMWVIGMIVYLVPLVLIGAALLFPRREPIVPGEVVHGSFKPRGKRLPLPSPPFAVDLLRMPLVGHVLRWSYTRRVLQVAFLLVAAIIIIDGFRGPQTAPLNLAGVLPWTHWRGFVVLSLLLAGNVSCMACPFTLPRAVGRRFVNPCWEWPRWLESKWLACGLLALFFWAYEAFDLWLSPWWTAWIVVGYFVAAFAVDMLFRGAAFCKYVCPVGQFQFVQSLVSPWQVRIRDPGICASCRTKECMRGSRHTRGCEMQLIVPRKNDNLDCTFCLDCVQACPAENVGVLAIAPLNDAESNAPRFGNAISRRTDMAALVLLLVFAAFANAAGMIAPTVNVERQFEASLGVSPFTAENLYLLLSLVIVPAVLLLSISGLAYLAGNGQETLLQMIRRFTPALVPLGAAMWFVHYGFHLVVGAAAAVPAMMRFAKDWGWQISASSRLVRSCCAAEPPGWLLHAEILCLDLGLLASLYAAYRIATADAHASRPSLRQFWPWSALIVILFALGVWIVFQPMEMRGTLSPAALAGGGP